jgi:hypothetical protein
MGRQGGRKYMSLIMIETLFKEDFASPQRASSPIHLHAHPVLLCRLDEPVSTKLLPPCIGCDGAHQYCNEEGGAANDHGFERCSVPHSAKSKAIFFKVAASQRLIINLRVATTDTGWIKRFQVQ